MYAFASRSSQEICASYTNIGWIQAEQGAWLETALSMAGRTQQSDKDRRAAPSSLRMDGPGPPQAESKPGQRKTQEPSAVSDLRKEVETAGKSVKEPRENAEGRCKVDDVAAAAGAERQEASASAVARAQENAEKATTHAAAKNDAEEPAQTKREEDEVTPNENGEEDADHNSDGTHAATGSAETTSLTLTNPATTLTRS